MMKPIFFLLLYVPLTMSSQDNCNFFKMQGDSCRYEACKYLEEAPTYFQLTREYHKIKDSAIAICPDYATVYRHKSTAYLKTGDFITWKRLINRAVELDPASHLDYRGWCRFQFFRDYEGAIKDIEELDRLLDYDIGYCQNGNYHLNIAKGLCYKMIGEKDKAIQIISSQIEKDNSSIGLFDYLHLGVLYLETEQYDIALQAFNQQAKINELAENSYYKALLFKKLNKPEKYEKYLHRAKEQYLASKYMFDAYTHQVDKVYLSDIERLLDHIE